ncbi:MAG: polysaccharide pyruvyl transferase [Verrucomicrobiaceae bacterium]|nr:polysaccharide pyruvyl transferase [Verrucomicrobiaceae bacterium]
MNTQAVVSAQKHESFDPSVKINTESAFAEIIAPPLKAQLALMTRLLNGIDTIALVDYPVSGNVGDSLIWLGQVELFNQLKKKVVYVDAGWHTNDAELRKVIDKGAAIIIMGGGNFGTVWPHHHRFREHLLQTFADATIIQMPQSIFFDDEKALAQTQRIVEGCPNFHFLVRDFPSLNFARANFKTSIEFCPDSAFFLGLLKAPPAEVDVLYLRRSDKESSDSPVDDQLFAQSNLTISVTDWLQQNLTERVIHKIVRNLIRFRLLKNTSELTFSLYNKLAWARANRGIQILARGRCIVTDRLHAHVLGMLIGRPDVLLDNSIGKIFNFHEAWTQQWPATRKAESLEGALALADTAINSAAAEI